ncbi:MAG: hypothetical protein QOI89_2899 [Solirubrobacteraceae bacterium]|nr:hypothetical protein [Solirubrobacteraceae bacterium]
MIYQPAGVRRPVDMGGQSYTLRTAQLYNHRWMRRARLHPEVEVNSVRAADDKPLPGR